MINELYPIYQGLRDVGQDPVIKHNNIASPGMGPTFRVCLAIDGLVEGIEFLTKEKIMDTWSLGNGNKNQFPAVKFEYPFIPDAHSDYLSWKDKNKNADASNYRLMIQDFLGRYAISLVKIKSWPSYRAKIEERKEQLKEELMKDPEGCCVYELFERFTKDNTKGLAILNQVGHKLIDKATIGGDKKELKSFADALFGDALDNKGKVKDGKRITLLMDCLPQKEVDTFASSRSRVQALSKALFALERKTHQKTGVCAVTGTDNCEIVKDKFPSEKLNVVGETILLAKSDSTSGPTVRRYGKAGTDSFSLNKLISEKLAAAIAFLTTEEKNGKTWKKIPSSTGTSPSLLLAYCKGKFDLAVTPAITGGEIEDFDDYENATATVLALFDRRDCTPDDAVEICEIRVLDKANRKVNYTTSTSMGRLRNAARGWVSACNNTPDFKLLMKIKKENKLLKPWAIPPIDTISLTKNKFIRKGASSTPVSSISFSDTMTLFMSDSDRVPHLAQRGIEKLVNQVEPLFEYCALSKTQSRLPKNKQIISTDTKKNHIVLKTATLLGALLYKAEKKKEVYMTSFAYQLGQLCSAMDELHIGYCLSIRGGGIPNTLIGNTAYNAALLSPMKSMALLASRIKPYKAWAKKVRVESKKTEDKSVIAGLAASVWIENHASELAAHFSEKTPSVTDTYKAELMLGYLAGRPFNEKKKESQPQ
jgi:hypothetical protein